MQDDEFIKKLKREYDLIQKPSKNIYIDKYIDYKTIKSLLEFGKLNLLVAPTGAGKTYSIMEAIKELSKENPTTCYIIACPNRIQNIQNKKYGVVVRVGGIEKEYNLKTVSMVYDLAEETIKQCEMEGREVVLIVDEAHQLIDAYNYRKKAIKGLLKLIENNSIKRTLFITATPKKIDKSLGIFNYNYTYYIRYKEKNKANNVKTLKILIAENKENTLINIIKQNKEKGIISVVELNDIEEQQLYELVLKNKGFNIETLHSKNKTYIYDSIIEKDIIPAGVDVLLTTSMLECGTNIKNTNVSFIAIPNKPSQLDLDCLEQFYARPRLYNKTFYLILKDPIKKEVKKDKKDGEVSEKNKDIKKGEEASKNKEKEKIKIGFILFENLVKKFGDEITERIQDINNVLENLSTIIPEEKSEFKKEVINRLVDSFSKDIESDGKSITRECIVFNDEFQRFEPDYYLFTKKVFKMFYQQYYYNIKWLKAELEYRIKCDEVIVEYVKDTISDDLKKDIKSTKTNKSKKKKDRKEEVKNILLEMLGDTDTSQDLLEDLKEYINDSKYLSFARQKEKISKLIVEKKSIELIRKMLDIGQDIKTSISIVANRKTDKEVKEKICEIGYINLNNIYGKLYKERNEEETNIRDPLIPKAKQVEYFIIRNILDEVMKSKGRLSEEKKTSLAKGLKLLSKEDNELIEQKKELSKATTTKLMKVINFVYVVTKDNKLTSLKK